MHISFLTNEYPVSGYAHGGIGIFIQRIAEKLTKRNIRVTIFCIHPSPQYAEDLIVENGLLKIIYQKQSNWVAFRFYDTIYRLNKSIKKVHSDHPIDVIEAPEHGLAFIKKIPGVAYVIRMHGGHHFFATAENRPLEMKKAWKERDSFKKADELVAVSNYTNYHTAEYMRYDTDLTTIIPNGINLKKFIPGEASQIIPHRILFAGTVIEKKGIRQLIMALPMVKKKFPDVELLVLGNLQAKNRATGKPYIDYLKDFIDPTVKENIRWVGFVDNDNLQEYMRTAEACVFPSHMETQGIVVAEAMAMEKLVIFGKNGPGPEVIEHQVTGLLCNPHSPEDIAEKIIEAFNDPDNARSMAERARVTSLARYDAEVLAQINIEFYKKAIANKKKKRS